MKTPPIEFLSDSFVYKEYQGTNDWSEPSFAEGVEVIHTRIDKGAEYSNSSSGKQLLYNGLIFCYADKTTPFIDFKAQSKVIYDGVEHVVKRVIPVKEPLKNKLYAYEIEVI